VSDAEWTDYRYFLAVARDGSLSAAARRMRVNQTTVGRRLAALEAAVGVRLFDRTPDGYALTAAGEGVRADLERVEAGLLAVERRLAGGDARIDGVVRIATPETFAIMFIVPNLQALRSRHPRLSLDLVSGIDTRDLGRREADLAVRVGAPPRQPNLVARRLGVVRFALYAAPSYLARRGRPRPQGGLRGHEIVAYGGEMSRVPIARWINQQGRRAEVAFRANTIAAVHAAVAGGLGLGVLPSVLAGRDLVRVASVAAGSSPVWMVIHQDLVRNARIRAVAQFLADVMRPAAPAGGPR
jgi:DNA-binding transcriptional LysR family regulator